MVRISKVILIGLVWATAPLAASGQTPVWIYSSAGPTAALYLDSARLATADGRLFGYVKGTFTEPQKNANSGESSRSFVVRVEFDCDRMAYRDLNAVYYEDADAIGKMVLSWTGPLQFRVPNPMWRIRDSCTRASCSWGSTCQDRTTTK